MDEGEERDEDSPPADNDPDFLCTRAESLENAGYRVLRAETPERALEILDGSHVHLAIIDIRMVDDDDERDTSGLGLAADPRYRPIPKIILTAFPSVDTTRWAMRQQADGTPYAYDYVEKIGGADKMIAAVETAISKHAGINWDLTIARDRRAGTSPALLLDAVDPRRRPEEYPERVGEIADLLRKLFREFDQVTLSRLFWSGAGRAALAALAFRDDSVAEYVVLCGDCAAVDAELARRHRFAPAPHNLQGMASAHTVHYAAAAWPFPGTDLGRVRTLVEFCRENLDREIGTAVDGLFGTTLSVWPTGELGVDEEMSAVRSYRERLGLAIDELTRSDLERRIDRVGGLARASGLATVRRSGGKLVFELPQWPADECLDPVPCMFDDGWLPSCRTDYATSPGGLEARAVLIDADRRAWLTDLAHAGVAPVCQDFVSLESSVRFELIESRSLVNLLDFERLLLRTRRLRGTVPLTDAEPECRRALRAILTIRARAAEIMGDDVLPYYIGLLFWTASGLARFDPEERPTRAETMSLVHRLLLSGLLCREIAELGANGGGTVVRTPVVGLEIDEDSHEVRVGGALVALSPTEYDLLCYLARRSGRLCRRRDILRDVFSIDAPTEQQVKTLVNSPMSRLRSRIEREPGHTFIVTVRGEGYKYVPRLK